MILEEVKLFDGTEVLLKNSQGWKVYGYPLIISENPFRYLIPMKRDTEISPQNNDKIIQVLENYTNDMSSHNQFNELVKQLQQQLHIKILVSQDNQDRICVDIKWNNNDSINMPVSPTPNNPFTPNPFYLDYYQKEINTDKIGRCPHCSALLNIEILDIYKYIGLNCPYCGKSILYGDPTATVTGLKNE